MIYFMQVEIVIILKTIKKSLSITSGGSFCATFRKMKIL